MQRCPWWPSPSTRWPTSRICRHSGKERSEINLFFFKLYWIGAFRKVLCFTHIARHEVARYFTANHADCNNKKIFKKNYGFDTADLYPPVPIDAHKHCPQLTEITDQKRHRSEIKVHPLQISLQDVPQLGPLRRVGTARECSGVNLVSKNCSNTFKYRSKIIGCAQYGLHFSLNFF